jgi:hypothetical protein
LCSTISQIPRYTYPGSMWIFVQERKADSLGTLSFPNSTSSRTPFSTSTPITVAAAQSSTSINHSSNITSNNASTSAICCCVVQDTISEEWWEEYSTTSTHGLVNLTAITTYVTQGPNGTTLSSTSTVTLTNTSSIPLLLCPTKPLVQPRRIVP